MKRYKQKVVSFLSILILLLSAGITQPEEISLLSDGQEKEMTLDERIEALEAEMNRPSLPAGGVADPDYQIEASTLEDDVQELKSDILQLNRELVILEQDILTPVSSQTAIFLSINKGHFFKLDGIKVKIDGNAVEHHLYTQQEVQALEKGAIQRVFTTNLAPGKHELVMVLSGFAIDGRDIKRAAEYSFYKPNSKKYIELSIVDNTDTQKVEFEFKEWE